MQNLYSMSKSHFDFHLNGCSLDSPPFHFVFLFRPFASTSVMTIKPIAPNSYIQTSRFPLSQWFYTKIFQSTTSFLPIQYYFPTTFNINFLICFPPINQSANIKNKLLTKRNNWMVLCLPSVPSPRSVTFSLPQKSSRKGFAWCSQIPIKLIWHTLGQVDYKSFMPSTFN